MDYRDTAIQAAKSLALLDGTGALIRLDSLMMVDFVIALEDAAGIQIPIASLNEDVFGSIDSVAKMLSTLAKPASP